MLGFHVHVEGNLCTCMFLLKTIVNEQMQVFEHQTQCTCILCLISAPHICCMNLHVFLLMKDNFTDQMWVSKGWGSLLKNLFNGINHEIDYSYFQCLILLNVNTLLTNLAISCDWKRNESVEFLWNWWFPNRCPEKTKTSVGYLLHLCQRGREPQWLETQGGLPDIWPSVGAGETHQAGNGKFTSCLSRSIPYHHIVTVYIPT